MTILIHPTYFPTVSHFVAMLKAETILLEAEDNFQKQTYRNRMYIYSPNGKQMLNIPVSHSRNRLNQKYKDIQIDYAEKWQKIHFKSLEAAYRSSPFFEYFVDDLRPLFEKKHNFLLDYNLMILEILQDCLGIKLKTIPTKEFVKETASDIIDLRYLVNSKKTPHSFEPYTQVFDHKHSFIDDLSILDVLFNEGRHAVDYFKRQELSV
ncbi:MAG TPA: WbqC family protein [Flavobacterium sp.]|nr:WbqC family protein [Flavobacterium sp.]